MSIPKIIHYCWFGGKPLNQQALNCIESWKRFCPGFEIMRWDESNAPLNANRYAQQAMQTQKWAFVSDYVRLAVLKEYGGIYLDTDVELTSSLEPFLDKDGFIGFQDADCVGTGLIACKQNHPFARRALALYGDLDFLLPDGSVDDTTNVERITALLVQEGLRQDNCPQTVLDVSVYPSEYFSPKNLETGKITLTEHTCAIHYFGASWMTPSQRRNTRIAQLIGPKWTKQIKRLLRR